MSVNILTISKTYNTQAKCLSLLEKIRWGKVVTCPYCESTKTKTAKNEAGRHSCRSCKRTFSVFIVESLEIERAVSDSQIKIVEAFDKREIFSLNIQFNAGVLAEHTHDFSRVKPDMIDKMTILLKKL